MRASPLALAIVLVASLAGAAGCYVDGPRFRPVRDSLGARPRVIRPAVAREDAPFVWVLGAVGQPGRYRVVGGAPGASVPTLTLVLRDAGGFAPSAYHTVIVSRREGARWARQAYDVDAIEAGEIDDVPIYAGDVIDVILRAD